MIPLPRLAATLLGALALAACGGAGDTAEGGEAENSRILEGSVSDAMIPYEKLRSEPPAARIEDGDGTARRSPAAGSGPASASETQGASDGAAPAPAAAPESATQSPAGE